MKIIAANFKTNHTRKSSNQFIQEVNQFLVDENITQDVFIFPPATALDVNEVQSNLNIGAQNAYPTKKGSFTGEIGTEQLDEFSIKTILIGHSERRHILKESQELIVEKYNYYKELGYKIIYCIGEPLEVKNEGVEATLQYCFNQLEGIELSSITTISAVESVKHDLFNANEDVLIEQGFYKKVLDKSKVLKAYKEGEYIDFINANAKVVEIKTTIPSKLRINKRRANNITNFTNLQGDAAWAY